MSNRREFLKITASGALFLSVRNLFSATSLKGFNGNQNKGLPIVISTWKYGLSPNLKAGNILLNKGSAIDAVEAGLVVAENELLEKDLNYNGIFDYDGHIKLDACIMNDKGIYASVASIEHIRNPVSVARRAMNKRPYILLVGDDALKFANENGFKEENLLTPKSKEAWKIFKESSSQKSHNNKIERLIGMLALDSFGNLSGASTSFESLKTTDRVGVFPIIGSGLYIDNEIGGACVTGIGESVIDISGCRTIVELMKHAKSPEDACKEAIERILSKQPNNKDIQVGFLALRKDGEIGACSVQKGFRYSYWDENENSIKDAKYTVGFGVKEYYVINYDCIACGACLKECPVKAISQGEIYIIDPNLCTCCGACADVCPVEAIHPN